MKKRITAICLIVLGAMLLIAGILVAVLTTRDKGEYTLTYAAGATDATGEIPEVETHGAGETFRLLGADTFVRIGYDFSGWNDGSKTYAAGAEYKMPKHDVTLTAQWSEVGSIGSMETVDKIPESELVTVNGTGRANWFASYEDEGFVVTAWVEDTTPYLAGNIYQNDSVRVYISQNARVRAYSENTYDILADVKGNLRVAHAATNTEKTDTGITAKAALVTIDGENAAGYCITITVPYSLVGISKAEKNAAVALCFTNASSATNATPVYETVYNTERTRVHTYIVVPANNIFERNPYCEFGAVWGDGGTLLGSTSWDLENDSAENGHIYLKEDDDMDNYVYMHGSNTESRKAYMEAEISVARAFKTADGYDAYPKFGIIVSNAAGTEKLFFFVDAQSDKITGDIYSTSVSLGTAKQINGGWDWNTETKAGDMSGTSQMYYPSGYIKLAVYREGDTVSFYANGVKKKTMSLGFGEDADVYFGLASFHLQLSVRNYRLETENFEGFDVEAQKIDYLFLGASTLTDSETYWYSYANLFKNESAANLSVPGYQVENWVNQLDSVQSMYDPKNVIMHIGMNNINNAGESGERVIERLQQLFGGLNERFPEAKLYYISITRNVNYSANDSKYTTVNNWAKNTASGTYGVTYIDVDSQFTRSSGSAQMLWFASDGYHLSSAGYALYTREIVNALAKDNDLPAYLTSGGGFGENSISNNTYSHTGDWTYEEGIWHGNYGRESRLPITNAAASGTLLNLYNTAIYATAKLSIVDVRGSYEKAGLAITSASGGTYFFYINLALETNNGGSEWNDHYAAVAYRSETMGKDWLYPEEPARFRPFGGNGYVNLGDVYYDHRVSADDYITLGVAFYSGKLYLFAGDKNANGETGAGMSIVGSFNATYFGNSEAVSVSVFAFNTELYVKDAYVTTTSSQVRNKVN